MSRWICFLSAFCMTGCFNGLLLKPTCVDGPIEETVMKEAHSCLCLNKVAVIDVEGVIMNARTSGLLSDGENPLSLFREKLNAAATDKRVKAVVLRINSPGGAVTASDIMHRDLLAFRHKTGKPVVACLMDVAASGGYYLAVASDRIIAHPTTVTGSIGVIMNLYNASGLMKMVGVTTNPIKSGPNKDIGNPGRPMTKQERAILQGMVNNFYTQFVQVVSEGRRLPVEEVRRLADGRVYTGIEAQKIGLVDEVGYLDDAIAAAKQMAGVCDAKVVAYDHCDGYRGSIYAGVPKLPSQINVKVDLPGLSNSTGAAFMYLWEPGVMQ